MLSKAAKALMLSLVYGLYGLCAPVLANTTENAAGANPNLRRLHALGIDAYRIAREIAARRNSFELDGMTGRLAVKFGPDVYQFRRSMQPAMYQNGMVALLPAAD